MQIDHSSGHTDDSALTNDSARADETLSSKDVTVNPASHTQELMPIDTFVEKIGHTPLEQLERFERGEASLRAVFFDLDGTLLPMELDEFLSSYFKLLHEFAAHEGMDADVVTHAVKHGVGYMMKHDSALSNEEAFWAYYAQMMGDEAAKKDAQTLMRFYEEWFPRIGDNAKPNPAVGQAISTLSEKGYALVVATMPLFPLPAVDARLDWAGVPRDAFFFKTSYDKSNSVKPHVGYFEKLLADTGFRADEVLMVGNNAFDDLGCMQAGITPFLVCDHLINEHNRTLDDIPHATMAGFAAWVSKLGICKSSTAVHASTGAEVSSDAERTASAETPCERG